MSESGDFDPGPWKGHDFKSAYRDYDAHVGRSYDDAVSSSKKKTDLLEKTLATESTSPLILACDVTGSMGEWPKVIFSKLPYLETEGKEYLGDDMEIAFCAIGDAQAGDDYPLQVRAFTKGTDLKKKLKELVIEGGGGSYVTESYELAALYFARNVTMPKAIKPILIIIGDEKPYDNISKELAKEVCGVELQKRITTEEVFAELKNKYSVYLIRKPYGGSSANEMSGTDLEIHKAWAELLGEGHIAYLPDPGRVVDVIFGILAKETGRIDYFHGEIEERQNPDQVETVYKSLRTIHATAPEVPALASGKSILMIDGGGGPKTKSLL